MGARESSIDLLIATLVSPNRSYRAKAARSLCNMGNNAIKAAPAILALHNDPWYQVRIQVARAIIHMEVDPDEATTVAGILLNDEDESVRLYAIEALRVLKERKF